MLQPYFNCALLVLAESLWSREGFEPGNRLPRKKSFSILIQFLVHFSLFLAFLTNDRVIFSCSLQTSPFVTVMIPKISDRKVKVWTRSHANGFLQQLFLFQKCMFKEWIHSTTHPYLKWNVTWKSSSSRSQTGTLKTLSRVRRWTYLSSKRLPEFYPS